MATNFFRKMLVAARFNEKWASSATSFSSFMTLKFRCSNEISEMRCHHYFLLPIENFTPAYAKDILFVFFSFLFLSFHD